MAVENQPVANSDNVAAIDPWSDGKLCNPKDHWDDSDGCPLGYISELLLNWPDSTPTVDLEQLKKWNAWYNNTWLPKSARGMYPLTGNHPESIKALSYSVFDSIKCARFNNCSSEPLYQSSIIITKKKSL